MQTFFQAQGMKNNITRAYKDSGTRAVVYSQITAVLCSQTGAVGREQRQPAGPVVPGLMCSQWYQDCDVFTVVPGLWCVHSGTRAVVCSQITAVLCSQTGALGREQRQPAGPMVPELMCSQWYQDCGLFTVVPGLWCIHRSLWFCVHRLEHWDVNNDNPHGQWYQDRGVFTVHCDSLFIASSCSRRSRFDPTWPMLQPIS